MTSDEKTKLLIEILKIDALAAQAKVFTADANYYALRKIIMKRMGRIDL